MNNTTKTFLLKTLQKEYIRRNLIKYFEEKGYDNFLINPYPPSLVDMTEKVELLKGIAEVSYFVEDINIENNSIKIGWNLFLLGNKRAFLGYTTHANLTDVENSVNRSQSNPNGPISIKEIIEWSVETLGKSQKLQDVNSNNGNAIDIEKPSYHSRPIPDFRRKV